jgi:5,10-methylenetetrahydromethanopterin reductase
MEIGLGLQSDKRPEEYIAIACRAEDAGFDVVSVFHDLLFQPAIVPLTLIAHATERVRVGPAALNARTLHPIELAGQAAALDLVSNGRAYLGVTDGAWLDRLGLELDAPLARMEETAGIVRRLFAGDRSGFAGEHFTLAPDTGFGYAPLRDRIPLTIGTWKPRMAALAGRIANEVKIGGCANPDMVRLMHDWIGNGDVGIVVGAVTVVDEDGDRARAHAQREIAMYLEVVGENDPTFDGPPTLNRFAFAGTPEEVAAHAHRLYDAGAKRVEFGTPQGLTTTRGVELLCDRVLPLLRRQGV